MNNHSDAEVFRQVGDQAEAQLAATVKARQTMSKLTARQTRIRDHAAKYYPHLQVEVTQRGDRTVLTFSNPARPAAGTLSVDGRLSPYTGKENNLASEQYPGQVYARVPLNRVTSRLAELA